MNALYIIQGLLFLCMIGIIGYLFYVNIIMTTPKNQVAVMNNIASPGQNYTTDFDAAVDRLLYAQRS